MRAAPHGGLLFHARVIAKCEREGKMHDMCGSHSARTDPVRRRNRTVR